MVDKSKGTVVDEFFIPIKKVEKPVDLPIEKVVQPLLKKKPDTQVEAWVSKVKKKAR